MDLKGLWICFGLLLLASSLAWALHQDAADCREAYPNFPEEPMGAECWPVCLACHTPTDDPSVPGYPLPPPDVAAEGDEALCGVCHEDEAAGANPGGYLLLNHGGNHPVDVSYDAARERHKLRADPQGPKLFTAPHTWDRKVHCSTCHTPMGATRHALRVDNTGSALCLSCHDI